MHQKLFIFGPFRRQQSVYQILDATLFIAQVELKPTLSLAHANVLGMKRKAHYPVTHTQIKTFTACSGAQQVSVDNVFLGPIPERILIALVKNAAFLGSSSTNPFHFHQCVTTNLVLYVNGVQHLPEPLTVYCSSHFGLPGLTKYSFQVRVFITMTVLT